MWSGQGRFGSIQEAMTWQVETQRSQRERLKQAMKDEALAVGRDVQKRVLGEPVLPVGISFNESPPNKGPTQEQKQ